MLKVEHIMLSQQRTIHHAFHEELITDKRYTDADTDTDTGADTGADIFYHVLRSSVRQYARRRMK